MRCTVAAVAAVLLVAGAGAQIIVSDDHAFAWGENGGWLNFKASPIAQVEVFDDHLRGWIWGENCGWISLGDGGPYPNNPADSSTYGVNRDPGTGDLSGFAWGENIGYVNFGGGALATPPNPARAGTGCRFSGYVWSETLGWFNLDDTVHYVGLLLTGDLDGNGFVDLTDLSNLLAHFGTLSGATLADGDLDGDGDVDLTDLAGILARFGTSCP